jgi:hypothetical protein
MKLSTSSLMGAAPETATVSSASAETATHLRQHEPVGHGVPEPLDR